ncbi:MAG: L,D-transpeptidase family protein [Bacteroidales bacterium]|nr:L,D-transpeptidase family protein [Bacteroidales bacterium]
MAIMATATAHAESDKWGEILDRYAADTTTRQIVLVKCTEGCNAEVEFYIKDDQQQWVLERADTAHIGRYGLGKKRQGDKKTPEGDFGIRQAFGIKPNPGTVIPWVDVTPDIWACGDRHYYNQIINVKEKPHRCRGEHMIKYVPSYNYGIATTYNDSNTLGLGAAIFFHCTSESPWTAGCVAVAEDFMVQILQKSDPGLKICIHQK